MKPSPAFATRKFPRGSYWITDPCYLYPDEEWLKFCDGISPERSGVYDYGKHSFFAWGTAYGDGMYLVMQKIRGEVSDIGSVGVDSGMLAIIPNKLVEEWGAMEKAKDLKKRLLATKIEAKRAFVIDEMNGDAFLGDDFCVDTSGFTCDDDADEDDE